MVKFEDLSPEDQERLLQQARLIIDEENIQKDAINTYKMKRKELTEQHLEDLYKAFNVKLDCDKVGIRQRFISMVNYLFRVKVTEKQYISNPTNYIISTKKEWEEFVKISIAIKNTMINVINYKEEE